MYFVKLLEKLLILLTVLHVLLWRNQMYNRHIQLLIISVQNFPFIEASRGGGAQGEWDFKRDRFWVRFPLEEMKYFIFSFLYSGVEAKAGVEFCHSTRNASRIR